MKVQSKIFLPLFVSLVFSTVFSYAQDVKDSSLAFPLLKFSYAFEFPGGDLADRFG